MKRARGFTLIELMIAVALAGLVVGGALQLHISFTRQSQRQQAIAEIQQNLRVAMLLVEKAIRSAGQGLPSTHVLPALVGASCTPVNYYGFQYSNNNAYNDPVNPYYTAGPNLDTDPDWFRVIASDTMGDSGATFAGSNGTHIQFNASGSQVWNANDLFIVIPDSSQPPNLSTCAKNCAQPYQVTTGYSGKPTAGSPGDIKVVPGQSCYDPPPGQDLCLNHPKGCAPPGAPLRHISGGGTVYRIMPASEQGLGATVSPKLTMRSAPFGTASTDPAHPWTVLADNIEDMQIAVILQDGTVCNYIDDPSLCTFATAAAVRVTLTGRSATVIPGASLSPMGGYEDAPTKIGSQPDGFIRRSMTTTVVLRNYT